MSIEHFEVQSVPIKYWSLKAEQCEQYSSIEYMHSKHYGTNNNINSVSTDLLIMSGLWFKCMHLGDRRKLLGKWLVIHALTKIRLAEGNEEA